MGRRALTIVSPPASETKQEPDKLGGERLTELRVPPGARQACPHPLPHQRDKGTSVSGHGRGGTAADPPQRDRQSVQVGGAAALGCSPPTAGPAERDGAAANGHSGTSRRESGFSGPTSSCGGGCGQPPGQESCTERVRALPTNSLVVGGLCLEGGVPSRWQAAGTRIRLGLRRTPATRRCL